MSEYSYVEKPFLDQLRALGWEVIDQGEGFPSQDPSVTMRATFRELILPDVFKESVRSLNLTIRLRPCVTRRAKLRRFVGFDIDVMNLAAKSAGFKVRFVRIEWAEIFRDLLGGEHDAVMSSVTITSERLKNMDFTVPYLVVGQVLVVRADAQPIVSLDGLQGKVVGVLAGSASESELKKAGSSSKMSVISYDSMDPMFPDLVDGKIDAFFCDDYYAASAIRSEDPKYKGKMKIAGPALTEEKFGVAVKKGNDEVLNTLNAGLKKVVDSKEYAAIKAQWLKGKVGENVR